MVICPFFRINFLDVCKLIKPLVPITHISHFILFIPHPHTYTPSPSYSFLVSHPPSYTPHIYTTSHHIITFYYAQQHNTSHCITSLSNISLRIFTSHHITSHHSSHLITSHHITSLLTSHITSHHISSHHIPSQSLGKVAIDVQIQGIDLLTIVGHKYGAPKGIAALYVREGIRYVPLDHCASAHMYAWPSRRKEGVTGLEYSCVLSLFFSFYLNQVLYSHLLMKLRLSPHFLSFLFFSLLFLLVL